MKNKTSIMLVFLVLISHLAIALTPTLCEGDCGAPAKGYACFSINPNQLQDAKSDCSGSMLRINSFGTIYQVIEFYAGALRDAKNIWNNPTSTVPKVKSGGYCKNLPGFEKSFASKQFAVSTSKGKKLIVQPGGRVVTVGLASSTKTEGTITYVTYPYDRRPKNPICNTLEPEATPQKRAGANLCQHALRQVNAQLPEAIFEGLALWNPKTKKIYLFGGRHFQDNDNADRFLNTIYKYDPLADHLEKQSATLPTPRVLQTGFVDPQSGLMYLVGGFMSYGSGPNVGVKTYTEIMVYNPMTDILQVASTKLPFGFAGGPSAFDPKANKGYIFGGFMEPGLSETLDIYVFDLNVRSFKATGKNLPMGVHTLSAAWDEDQARAILVGGTSLNIFHNNRKNLGVYGFSPQSLQLTKLTDYDTYTQHNGKAYPPSLTWSGAPAILDNTNRMLYSFQALQRKTGSIYAFSIDEGKLRNAPFNPPYGFFVPAAQRPHTVAPVWVPDVKKAFVLGGRNQFIFEFIPCPSAHRKQEIVNEAKAWLNNHIRATDLFAIL